MNNRTSAKSKPKKVHKKKTEQELLNKRTKKKYEWEKEGFRLSSWKEGWKEGWRIGLAEGSRIRLISQIQKKHAKGKPLSTIAEELEDSEEALRPLYELVTKHPDSTSEEMLELWKKEKQ